MNDFCQYEKFSVPAEREFLVRLMSAWREDELGPRAVFRRLAEKLSAIEDVRLSFVSRPGVSHSLRATLGAGKKGKLLALVDVIDDDPDDRWLSVCFYASDVTDPAGSGNLVPQGLQGEDGRCFDVWEFDEDLVGYLGKRIEEAKEAGIRDGRPAAQGA